MSQKRQEGGKHDSRESCLPGLFIYWCKNVNGKSKSGRSKRFISERSQKIERKRRMCFRGE